MNYRLEKFNKFGTIDADVYHSDFGWIPCTFSPHDEPTAHMFHAAARTAKPYVETEE